MCITKEMQKSIKGHSKLATFIIGDRQFYRTLKKAKCGDRVAFGKLDTATERYNPRKHSVAERIDFSI